MKAYYLDGSPNNGFENPQGVQVLPGKMPDGSSRFMNSAQFKSIAKAAGGVIEVFTELPELHESLDVTTTDMQSSLSSQGYGALYNSLRRWKIESARDMVTLGSSRMLSIEGLGLRGVDRVRNVLGDFGLDKIFGEQPGVYEAAHFCRNLDEVHVGVLGLGWGYHWLKDTPTVGSLLAPNSLLAALGDKTNEITSAAMDYKADFVEYRPELSEEN